MAFAAITCKHQKEKQRDWKHLSENREKTEKREKQKKWKAGFTNYKEECTS